LGMPRDVNKQSSHVTQYHVTVLSNFARAFDKYSRRYRKSLIPESAYPNEFYVLPREELRTGAEKASRLLNKLDIPGNRLIALEASLPFLELRPNLRNGIGAIWPSFDLPISALREIDSGGNLGTELSLEEAMADALLLHAEVFAPYADLKPRTIAFLPIAKGCQAACPFCFSEASASAEQKQARLNWSTASRWIDAAADRGAERAVITGGGEPTLMRPTDLARLVESCRSRFKKVVLITNGIAFAQDSADGQLEDLAAAGLSVLAVSRHHPSETINAALMGVETRTPDLLRKISGNRHAFPNLTVRLVCVLQRNGIATLKDIDEYVAWAAELGADEVCFKELYVSTSRESVYHSRAANAWCARQQVNLSPVLEWATRRSFGIGFRLPWGSPVFGGKIEGRNISVAAYTEPSLFWERSTGIARSWNIMSDGTCLASLEDRHSAVELPGAAPLEDNARTLEHV
jgi:pyruvate-formate lyase-activating enzyme